MRNKKSKYTKNNIIINNNCLYEVEVKRKGKKKEAENLERLKNKIYKTKKCRIEAEERVKKKEKFFLSLNIYYAALLIVFSILLIVSTKQAKELTDISAYLICISLATFSVSMITSLQNYRELMLEYRRNYLSLEELYERVKNGTNLDSVKISEEYNRILISCPTNHEDIDYYTMLMKDSDLLLQSSRNLKSIWKEYYLYKIKWLFTQILLIGFPFVMPFILKMISSGLGLV